MSLSKQALRQRIWRTLTARGVTRFPGAPGRIPNFVGAEITARQIAALRVWQEAKTIKCNPDSPQRPVRHAALKAGKLIYMAVLRLRNEKPFFELNPTVLRKAGIWRASSIRGAFSVGKPVTLQEMSPIDLIVAGSVAVSRDGAHLGKGGGYSDLEYALSREAGLMDDDTPVVTTVHALQVVPEGGIEMTDHDIAVNCFTTPDEIVWTDCQFRLPLGILWAKAGDKLDEIPALQDLEKVGRCHTSGPAR